MPKTPTLVRYNSSATIPALPKYDDRNLDHQFWWDACSPSVKTLLACSGTYTAEQQQSQLQWFRDTAVPHLGPSPSPTYRPSSLLNWEGSPYRPSWNFCQDTATVRLGLDPTGSELGTPEDPFRQNILSHTMPMFACSSSPAVDLTWFNEVTTSMYLTPQEEAALQAKWPANTPPPPVHFLAWGCKSSQREFKPYFHPFLKVAATGKPVAQVIYDGVRNIRTLGDELKPAIDTVERFQQSRKHILTPAMIGIDCVEPAKARCNIYVWAPSNAFDLMRDAMTLGGKMDGPETLRGVQILGEIYHLLLGEKQPSDPGAIKTSPRGKSVDQASILSWEMKPGRLLPEVKIYLPLWVYAETEADVIDNLSNIFRHFGWDRTARMYGSAIQEAFPHVDIRKAAGTHAWISFAYSDKKGPYMTVYLAPRIQEAWEALGNSTRHKWIFSTFS
ncbi:tryptophan dimethylallyltransferase-domain-containing protein [Diplogelasinospora grovesii]|uniref:Tryptophan dimethylallyltransferase-domain-containing protein n=1 Tax=Diplogelasinospora grovesii TaxID=303347 RepID=A0AAN6N322_9PEZI|nr:tryptophan dimethylallyltransferase-domain-containing protein [Diplogelasinospora grovesii]